MRNAPVAEVDLDALTILDLQRWMADGTLSAVELTRSYLGRIRRIDPLIRAVITRFASATGNKNFQPKAMSWS